MPTLRLPQAIQGVKANSVTVKRWLRSVGHPLTKGQPVVELDVEDALILVEAPANGVLSAIAAVAGKTVALGAELGSFEAGTAAPVSVSLKSASKPEESKPMSAKSAGPVTPVLMPQAGNSMEEGKIIKWRVKVGDRIAVGQVIMDVETDKATVEVEATDAGRLARIVANEGDVVPVKQPVAYLAESDADVEAVAGRQKPGEMRNAECEMRNGPAVSGGKVVPVLMPQAGNTMEEGTVLKWRVKVGEAVAVGQILYDVETDKATVEVEATDAGRLARIVAPEGAVVPVKQAVAYLADNDADVDAFIAAGGVVEKPAACCTKAETQNAERGTLNERPVVAAPISTGGRVIASPAARKLARDRGLDLASVGAGSGPGGRIITADLEKARPAATVAKAAPAAPANNGQVVRRPMSKMRKAIAVNLQTSKQTVPHFYVKLTINAEPLFAFYKAQKPATGCTLNDVILLAVGRTVGDFPAFRSRVEGNDIVEMPAANIGVAVSVDDGLVVPVVPGVQGLTLGQLASDSKRIVEAARKGKVENMGKGVFTISNMGMLGVEEFAAIINPPESGILAIAAVRESVIVKDGAMKPARVMTMTLSVDHRVVDGALAAAFMAKLKERLEAPEMLV